MDTELEKLAERNERIRSEITLVRGHAETSGGAVVVETDVNGTITDLRITQAAMSVDPARLAKAIAQCHETARARARQEATRVFAEIQDLPEPATTKGSTVQPPANGTTEWEEAVPLRITHTL
ncbi:YbaB/EbfC family nucleoid-associated protein [Nocardia sp. NPDC004340]